jgi:hypothetical protein
MGSLRVINVAAATYASACNRGFPPTLAALGPAKIKDGIAISVPNEKAAYLIGEDLASGIKEGWRITYTPGPLDSDGRIQTYTVHADPLNPQAQYPYDMHYFTDQSGVIRAELHKEATENSPPIAG